MHRFAGLLVVCACCIAMGACGSSSSSSTASTAAGKDTPEAISAQDRDAASRLTAADRSWERAYSAWDKAYRAGDRAAFLAAVSAETPKMKAAADKSYQAAASVDDPGLRAQYVKLARWYLDQTSAVLLVGDYVKSGDTKHFESSVHHLDRVRRRGLTLAEKFQNYFQQRFGINPADQP